MKSQISKTLKLTVTAALAVSLAVLPVRTVAQANRDSKGAIVTFDAPDAGKVSVAACAPYCGTFPFAVNDRGVIVGFYTDKNIVPYAFLRTPDGHITSFQAPGAGTGHGLDQGTVAISINNWGVVAGQFQDPSYVLHGFVRYPDDTFTTFDAPGAGTGAFQGTPSAAINLWGQIAGYDIDAGNVYHGFLRTPDGAITTFDAPGAGTEANQGTVIGEKGINWRGEIDGWYIDQNYVYHGFLRAPDGSFTTIDPPGSQFTIAGGINPFGAIAGYYLDVNNACHGFLRARDGTFTTFDAPGGATGSNECTAAFDVNLEGAVTGIYYDANNVLHGFVRHPEGSFATFEAPGAGNQASQGTRPEYINAAGVATGFYYDANGLGHGFLRLPCSQGGADCRDFSTAAQSETRPATQPPSTVVPVKPALGNRIPLLRRGPAN